MADDDDDAGKLAKAYLAARDMEQTRSYLERGRAFEAISLAELQARYVAAGEAFFGQDDQSRVREFQDLDAEYRLRRIDAPAALLKPAVNVAAERIKRFSKEDLEPVTNRLSQFLDAMDKPKN